MFIDNEREREEGVGQKNKTRIHTRSVCVFSKINKNINQEIISYHTYINCTHIHIHTYT